LACNNPAAASPLLALISLIGLAEIGPLLRAPTCGRRNAAGAMFATPLRERITERSAAGALPALSIRRPPAAGRCAVRGADGPRQLIVLAALPSGSHPASIGTRQAPDGNYDLGDPTRSGKYLRIDRTIAVLARSICGVPDGGRCGLPAAATAGYRPSARAFLSVAGVPPNCAVK
jgi:hypothetical protein